MHLSVLGQRVDVHGSSELLDQIAHLWRSFLVAPTGAESPSAKVVEESQRCCLEARVAAVSIAINAHALGGCNATAIHAGVVSGGGRVVALPAVSGVGKSTTVAALMRNGWRYVSDEALCLALGTHTVVPYPKPIALDPAAAARLGAGLLAPRDHKCSADKIIIPAAVFGDIEDIDRMNVNDVVLLNRGHRGPARLQPRSRGETVPVLVSLCFNHYRNGEEAFRATADVAQSSRLWRLDAAQPADAVDLLTSALWS